jgi:hypothetical protein
VSIRSIDLIVPNRVKSMFGDQELSTRSLERRSGDGCAPETTVPGERLANEACLAVIGFALDLHCVMSMLAKHGPDDIAPGRFLEEVGFRYTHDELSPPIGLMHPSYFQCVYDLRSVRREIR